MGLSLRKDGSARAPRSGTTIGTPAHRNVAAGFGRSEGFFAGLAALFGAFWGLIVLAFWVIKIVAFVILVFAIIAIVGALLNGNQPVVNDIVWAIVSFIAVVVL